jgi:predicted nucleic acid-binding protein
MRSDEGLNLFLDKAVILDSDIASAFAKIGRLDLLNRLLSRHPIFITPRIYEELTVPIHYGYTFPLDIFTYFDVIYPSEEENKMYRNLLIGNISLGKGEMEALSICKNRGYVFASMDNVALKYAQAEGVETLKLYSILRALWELGIQSKDDVRDIIKKLEVHDKTRIKDIDLIFE